MASWRVLVVTKFGVLEKCLLRFAEAWSAAGLGGREAHCLRTPSFLVIMCCNVKRTLSTHRNIYSERCLFSHTLLWYVLSAFRVGDLHEDPSSRPPMVLFYSLPISALASGLGTCPEAKLAVAEGSLGVFAQIAVD